MARNTNEDEFGHYHDQKRTDTTTVKIGKELVTTKHTYCSKCGKWVKSKILSRQKLQDYK